MAQKIENFFAEIGYSRRIYLFAHGAPNGGIATPKGNLEIDALRNAVHRGYTKYGNAYRFLSGVSQPPRNLYLLSCYSHVTKERIAPPANWSNNNFFTMACSTEKSPRTHHNPLFGHQEFLNYVVNNASPTGVSDVYTMSYSEYRRDF